MEGMQTMRWAPDFVGHLHGTDGTWDALVICHETETTWSAYVYPARSPEQRHEHLGFADAEAAKAWCEETIDRLRIGSANGEPI
jgi:hypothetical protein